MSEIILKKIRFAYAIYHFFYKVDFSCKLYDFAGKVTECSNFFVGLNFHEIN